LALVLDGTFSVPPPPVAASSPPLLSSLPSVPPGPAEVSLSSSLPDELAYQTPPPTISPIARTAATMITIWALSFRPPCGACGCSGIVVGC
jgi:hypothetical protein